MSLRSRPSRRGAATTLSQPVNTPVSKRVTGDDAGAANWTDQTMASAEALLRRRFESALAPLFLGLTGHRVRVLGRDTPPGASQRRSRMLCPAARAGLLRRGILPAICHGCSLVESPGGLPPVDLMRCTRGRCHALTFVLEVRIGSALLATLVCQLRPDRSRHGQLPAKQLSFLCRELLRLIQHDLQETAWHWHLSRNPVTSPEPDQPAQPQDCPSTPPPFCAPASQTGAPPTVVGLALDFLEQNFSRPITLKALAAQLHRNPSYLSDLIARTGGASFRQRLRALRLARAQELLADGHLSVGEIARAVGFTEPHEFRWAFKRWTGVTPTTWRNGRQSCS